MIVFLRKNITSLILNPNSNNVCKSPVYSSLYSKSLSTSTESGPCIKLCDILVHKHSFAPEFASRVASKLTRVKNPENAGLILSFLRESGFLDNRLEKIVMYRPQVFSASLEFTVKPKIKYFQELGLSSDHISKMISCCPRIFYMSLNNNIIPSVALLKDFLGSNDKVARLIRKFPRMLPSDLVNTMLPNVEFFKSCGVPMERIRVVLSSYPGPFLMKPEIMKEAAEKAKEMGLDASSNGFIYAVPTIASLSNETLVLKLQVLRSLGFSDSDIGIMFRKEPVILAVSVEKVKKIKELLLDTGKYTISSIVQYPKSLQSSIEKRYMPRLQILGNLESRKQIKEWPPLSRICLLTDNDFLKKFVIPYSDKVSDICSIEKPVRDERR